VLAKSIAALKKGKRAA